MRKLLCAILAVLMVLSIAGCGSKDEEGSSKKSRDKSVSDLLRGNEDNKGSGDTENEESGLPSDIERSDIAKVDSNGNDISHKKTKITFCLPDGWQANESSNSGEYEIIGDEERVNGFIKLGSTGEQLGSYVKDLKKNLPEGDESIWKEMVPVLPELKGYEGYLIIYGIEDRTYVHFVLQENKSKDIKLIVEFSRRSTEIVTEYLTEDYRFILGSLEVN